MKELASGVSASGQITFRVPISTHENLLAVARTFGIDLTSLLNQMIAEQLPHYLDRARQVLESRRREEQAFTAALTASSEVEDRLINSLLRAAYKLGNESRDEIIKTMARVCVEKRSPSDPPCEEVLLKALEVFDRQKRLEEIKSKVMWEDFATKLTPEERRRMAKDHKRK